MACCGFQTIARPSFLFRELLKPQENVARSWLLHPKGGEDVSQARGSLQVFQVLVCNKQNLMQPATIHRGTSALSKKCIFFCYLTPFLKPFGSDVLHLGVQTFQNQLSWWRSARMISCWPVKRIMAGLFVNGLALVCDKQHLWNRMWLKILDSLCAQLPRHSIGIGKTVFLCRTTIYHFTCAFWGTPHMTHVQACVSAEDTHGPNAGTNGASTAVFWHLCCFWWIILVDCFGEKWEMIGKCKFSCIGHRNNIQPARV